MLGYLWEQETWLETFESPTKYAPNVEKQDQNSLTHSNSRAIQHRHIRITGYSTIGRNFTIWCPVLGSLLYICYSFVKYKVLNLSKIIKSAPK